MLLLSLTNISKRFDEQVILENASLAVHKGDKIGLVGRNGAGKTTLFNIISRQMRPDRGSVDCQKGLLIGGVAQELDRFLELSLYDFCFLSQPETNDIRHQMARLEAEMTADSPPLEIVSEYQTLTVRYEEIGGYRMETEIKLVLEGIGFTRSQISRPLSSFSGGERNRAQIAAALVGDYDLLLLDEPTNHLDIESTIWLENYIAASQAAYIIISHDRRFLQGTVDKIAQISLAKLDLFHCRYDKFLEEREKRLELAAHQYRHQAEEIARIEDFIRRNMAGQKTKQAQSRQKYLSRMKKLERPRVELNRPTFHIKDGGRSFRQVVKVEHLAIGYENLPLVESISFEQTRGDRIGLIGPNGCGKTTLLRTLGGLLEPISGEITVGQNVDVAYFDQELSNLNLQSDVISELWEIDPLAESGRLRSFLARFGFIGEDVFKRVSNLSGGEKTKLSLAKILYRPANLMIFDEPTNHLDIESIEALEEGLANYHGTLLVVSHDREFLDHVVNQIFEIAGPKLNRYLGNYSNYAEKRKATETTRKVVSEEKKASYEEFKEKSRQKSRYKKRLKQLKEMIAEREQKWHDMETEELVVDSSDWERLNAIREERKTLEEQILELYIEKEAMERIPPDE
jgi:ATP-binding cassette subfamily F protein 3